MKNAKLLFLLLGLACWTLPSCDQNDKPKDSEKMADKANDAKTETNRSEEDAELMVNAVSSDLYEIAAAEMAATMATQSSIKDFANQMLTAHRSMMDETRALAAKKAYTVPTTMANDYMTNIEDMRKWAKGKEFDTKYMEGQVKQHEKMLEQIEKRMNSTADSDVKMWTQKASSGVRMHLDMAKKIDDQLDMVYK